MRLYFTAAAVETDPTDNNGQFTTTIIPLAPRADVHQFIWCAGVFLVLVSIWTGLRIYSRSIRRLDLGVEDALYYASVVSSRAHGCLLAFMVCKRSTQCRRGSFAHVVAPSRFSSSASSWPYSWVSRV
jgi:hypothetical protein